VPTPNEVELLIKARNEAGRTLDQLAKELDEIVESQKALASSTELAQKSQKDLTEQAKQLLGVLSGLERVQSKVEGYKRQQQAIDDLNKRLAEQRTRLQSLKTELDAAEKPTKKLQDAYALLGRNIAATEKQITKGGDKLLRLGEGLEKVGVSIADFANEERRLASEQGRVTAALDTTRVAAGRLEGAQNELRDAEKRRQDQATATASEVKRRAAEEEAAIKRRIEAQKRFNDLTGVRPSLTARDREGTFDVLGRLEKELDRQQQVEAALARQKQIEIEIAKRNAEQEASLRRQVDAQTRINSLLNVRAADPERARSREADVRAAVAEEAARREVRAQELRIAASQRVLEVNQRADAVEARLRQRQQESVGATTRLATALRGLLGVQERATTLTERQAAAQAKNTGQAASTAAAIDKVAAAQNRQNKAMRDGLEAQRTALSLYQRIRGQLLSVAGAYVGLFGALNLVQQSIKTVNERASIQARLLAANSGDVAASARDYAFARAEAERLGISLDAVSGGYARLRTAGASVGQNLEATRFIFSSFAEALRGVNADSTTTERVFKALDQIISKGTISAEDYKGQIGDALPSAMVNLSKAMNMPIAQIVKLQEEGKVSADFLLLVAREYKKQFAVALPAATTSLQANIERLKTSIGDFQEAFLNSEFRAELERLIKEFTVFLKSDDGKKFARDLGAAFAGAAKILRFLIENIEAVGITLGVVFGARTIQAVIQFGGVLASAARGAAALSTALGVGGLVTAARTAGIALAALITGPLGILIGLAATGIVIALKFKVDDAKALGKGVDEAVKAANKASVDVLSAKTQAELRPLLEQAKQQVQAIDKSLADAKRALTREQASFFGSRQAETTNPDVLRKREEAAFGSTRNRIADLESRRAALVASIEGAERKIDQLPAVAAEGVSAVVDGSNQLTSALDAQFKALEAAAKSLGTGDDKEAKKAANKAATAAKQLADLQLRLKEQFSEQAAAIGKDLAEAEAKSFDRARQIIDADSNEKIRELENLRAAFVKSADQVNKLMATAGAKISAELRAALKAGNFDEFSTEIDALIEKVNIARTRATETARAEFAAKDFSAAETEVNRLMSQRAEIIQTENALREAGLRTSREAADNIKTQTEQLDPLIDAALNKAIDLAYALGGPEGEAAVLRIQSMRTEMELLRVALSAAEQQVVQIFASNLNNAFESAAQSVGELISGVQSFGDFIKSLGQITQQFFSQLLIDIGLAIARQVILNALLSAAKSGGAGGTIIGAIAGLMHDGGVAGKNGTPTIVDPRIFRNATRYHDGGIVGLKPDEVPAILQKGETVIPKGGAAPGGASNQNIQVLNTIDTESIYQAAQTSSTFRKTILNVVRAERSSFKQALA